ncbi:hypothetical protein HOLleu_25534 [Holothuria leucospilota]|uniref:Uncharacterized protein n=1 Tax=Holothuria leucospilota TaxID=206669 RepID=A0A9Q1H1X2_HOLLE|nr:hypothetical protein HOLleu_25534 [Holothuria leucospilota]
MGLWFIYCMFRKTVESSCNLVRLFVRKPTRYNSNCHTHGRFKTQVTREDDTMNSLNTGQVMTPLRWYIPREETNFSPQLIGAREAVVRKYNFYFCDIYSFI